MKLKISCIILLGLFISFKMYQRAEAKTTETTTTWSEYTTLEKKDTKVLDVSYSEPPKMELKNKKEREQQL